jgi:membrane associated rhomboid family serine protease
MVFSPVGIKCPECAGTPTGPRQTVSKARRRVPVREGIVTTTLIAVNVGVFLLQLGQAGRFDARRSAVFFDGALFGPFVADGDWWRLVTASFLHVNLIHLMFNMLMLWWFGRQLESYLGSARFAGVYAVAILAGAAGALLLAPDTATVGASGGVFGILGAGLVLERRRIYIFGGQALFIVILNIALSFALSNVSIGGHLGGLFGGMAAMLVLTQLGRSYARTGRLGLAAMAGLAGVGAFSILVAYLRVRGLA